ncbi:PAS domain S-box protein [Phenylobacterium sp. LjRoot164]|uniref:PAS domain-containing hybrid sensor histidine kinase/response regulator n=1 Tax=unclassified Phenylobacterium TaxID=2640670 RepID=UPI003ECCAA30
MRPFSKAELDQERERLARMFEQAPSLMALLREPEHQIVLANAAFRSLFGDMELAGRKVADILPPSLARQALEALDEAYSSGSSIRRAPVPFPAPGSGAPGDERLVDLVLQPITDRSGAVMGIFVQGSDVTDRIRAEQRVRSSLKISTVGIVYWDPEFRLIEVNDAFLNMGGYVREDLVGRSWRHLTPPEYWPLVERAISQVETTRESIPYEKQYFRKDGTRWWGRFAARRVSTSEVVEFVLDVTERREAEEALRDRERRLQLIVDTAIDYVILTTDPERRVTSWSPGATRILGFEAEDIVGRSADILFTPEDRAAGVPEEETGLARRDGAAPDVRWHLRKDGGRVFLSGSLHLMKTEGREEVGYFKIARDETERRRSELEIRDAEERFRLAVRATKDAIWDWDLVSDRIDWNEAVEPLFGYRPADIEPTSQWWKGHVHPDDRDRVIATIEDVVAGGEASWAAEYRFRRRDESYADVVDRGTVLRDDDGTPLRMVGAMHDLTRHKEAQAYLRQLNETLEHRVHEEVSARLRTEEALRQSQKLEAIGQLTGGVAHDFNNLLTVIRGAAEMLRRPSLPEARRERYVEAIFETAERAAKLTGQLLAFSRRQALRPEVFDVGARIEAIRDMLATVVGSRVTLVTRTDCATCFVEADPIQFETALVNMAVNARDAMDGAGELRISLQLAAKIPRIRGHGEATGDFVAVKVRDTGAGIASDKLGQIFEPFFTTKEVGKGTGLGLSQVYGFAKQSGGEVDVVSRLGAGTTFTLYLPRTTEQTSSIAELDNDTDEVEGRGHILVVEDNEQVGAFSTELLAELGFETTWAPGAEAALKILREEKGRFAAVFSDVVMPGMNGVELGQEIRRQFPTVPVILASGYSHVLAQESRHGFELLHKPYSIEDLTRVLRRSIRDRPAA